MQVAASILFLDFNVICREGCSRSFCVLRARTDNQDEGERLRHAYFLRWGKRGTLGHEPPASRNSAHQYATSTTRFLPAPREAGPMCGGVASTARDVGGRLWESICGSEDRQPILSQAPS